MVEIWKTSVRFREEKDAYYYCIETPRHIDDTVETLTEAIAEAFSTSCHSWEIYIGEVDLPIGKAIPKSVPCHSCDYYMFIRHGRILDVLENKPRRRQGRHRRNAHQHKGERKMPRKISPAEKRYFADEYHYYPKEEGNLCLWNLWDFDETLRISRSWKDQTKRSHQWERF